MTITSIFVYSGLVIVCFLGFLGIFQFVKILLKAPLRKSSKAITHLANRRKAHLQKSSGGSSVVQLISKFVFLSDNAKTRLAKDLETANVTLTPEMYIAGAAYKPLLLVLACTPFYLLFPFIIVIILLIAMVLYNNEKNWLYKKIRKRKREIDLDLPRFVYAITQEIKMTHDVLTILEHHKDNYSDTFGTEIAITIADMRTGNYEAALQRFENRIASSRLSEVIRGLVEMIHGNDTTIYWETLAFRFSEMQKQELRTEADKVPAKMNKLSFVLLLMILLIYGVVLVNILQESSSVFF